MQLWRKPRELVRYRRTRARAGRGRSSASRTSSGYGTRSGLHAARRARSHGRLGGASWSVSRTRRGLNELQADSLRYRGPGTDLTVGLLPNVRWASGAADTSTGIHTSRTCRRRRSSRRPTARRTEGTLRSSMPLPLGGQVVARPRADVRGGPDRPRRGGDGRGPRSRPASRRSRTPTGSARSPSSTTSRASARPGRSSTTRSTTRTPPATSRTALGSRSCLRARRTRA